MKFEKKDIIFVGLTFVACLVVGLISNFVLQDVTESLGLLSKVSYVVVSIIVTIAVVGITILKGYFADRNKGTGTSKMKYIISMIIGFVIFFLVLLLVDSKFNTEHGLESIFTLFAFVGLKILFDTHFDVRYCDFLSTPFIVLFIANEMLATFISLVYSKAIFWTVISLLFLIFLLKALEIDAISLPKVDNTKYGMEAFDDGYKAALEGRPSEQTNGYYYDGYIEGEKARKKDNQ